jgi:hypothetical protein
MRMCGDMMSMKDQGIIHAMNERWRSRTIITYQESVDQHLRVAELGIRDGQRGEVENGLLLQERALVERSRIGGTGLGSWGLRGRNRSIAAFATCLTTDSVEGGMLARGTTRDILK